MTTVDAENRFSGSPATVTRKRVFLDAFRRVGVKGQAATVAGVTRQCVHQWAEHDEAFAAALGFAREDAADLLETELTRRATGYQTEKQILEVERDEDGRPVVDAHGDPRFVIVRVERKVEASDTCLIFALKGARPEKWRELRDVRLSGGMQIEQVSSEQVDAALAYAVDQRRGESGA